jgi:anti-sigma factor RsiW
MECPDRELLSRLIDGEESDPSSELHSHIRSCERCRKRARDEDALGTLLRRFFEKSKHNLVKESGPCPSAEEIALYAEGRAPVYRKGDLMRHFCACPACARAVLDITATRGAKLESPPPDLVREARAVFRKEKDDA